MGNKFISLTAACTYTASPSALLSHPTVPDPRAACMWRWPVQVSFLVTSTMWVPGIQVWLSDLVTWAYLPTEPSFCPEIADSSFCEFQASLIYKVNFRTARAVIQRNSVLKKQKTRINKQVDASLVVRLGDMSIFTHWAIFLSRDCRLTFAFLCSSRSAANKQQQRDDFLLTTWSWLCQTNLQLEAQGPVLHSHWQTRK